MYSVFPTPKCNNFRDINCSFSYGKVIDVEIVNGYQDKSLNVLLKTPCIQYLENRVTQNHKNSPTISQHEEVQLIIIKCIVFLKNHSDVMYSQALTSFERKIQKHVQIQIVPFKKAEPITYQYLQYTRKCHNGWLERQESNLSQASFQTLHFFKNPLCLHMYIFLVLGTNNYFECIGCSVKAWHTNFFLMFNFVLDFWINY